MSVIYCIYRHVIGLPEYLDIDLSDSEDCFIFFNERDAKKCVEVMTQDAGQNDNGETYKYYYKRCEA